MTPSLRAGAALLCAVALVRHAAAQTPPAAGPAAARRDTMLPDSRFRIAILRDPTNVRLHLDFGRWYRSQSLPWLRSQGAVHFRVASRMAREQGDHALEAEAELELAKGDWVAYERFGHAYQLIGTALGFDVPQSMADWQYVENFFSGIQVRPDTNRGEMEVGGAERHARAAIAAMPGHPGATGLLAVILGDQARWEELLGPARAAVRAHPDSPDGYRILGLALHQIGRTREAARAFADALARMNAEQRRPYDDLGLILRRADQARYASLPEVRQTEMRRLYWAVAQPLALDSVNPVQVEYYGRATYVDLRWSVPEEHLVGWQSDRGATWLRYGPPERWVTLSGGATDSNFLTIWVYPRRQARFVFQGMGSYTRATFAGDYAAFAEDQRHAAPVRFDNLPVVAEMDTIVAQLAQFMGPGGSTTLAVFGFVPVGRMLRDVDLRSTDFEIGAIVKDGTMADVVRRVGTERVTVADSEQFETRTWRMDLAPRDYLLRLEARQPATRRSARAMSEVAVERFGPGALRLSDLVLADRIEPRDSAPMRWTDYFVDPSAGRVRGGAPIAFLWELYNLTGDSSEVGRYRVELGISVRSIERHGFGARIFGGMADAVGVSALGDTLVSLSFERAVSVRGRSAVPNHLDVELRDAPNGQYTATVTVTDLRTGQAARRTREFVVTARPGERPRGRED